jgi:hypothetical protein
LSNVIYKGRIIEMAFSVIPVFLAIVVLTAGMIFLGLKRKTSGMKLMLLGISILLFGGIIAVDPDSNLGGIEYLISFSGLLITIVGFGKQD